MPEPQLSLKQAYLAMFAFLDQTQKTLGSEDLAELLGGMSLLPDGFPADPAYWQEWEEAVGALADVAAAQLSLKQAYLAMFAFLEHMQETLESNDLALLLSNLSLLPDGSSADPACWQEWEEAVERALKEPRLAELVLVKPHGP